MIYPSCNFMKKKQHFSILVKSCKVEGLLANYIACFRNRNTKVEGISSGFSIKYVSVTAIIHKSNYAGETIYRHSADYARDLKRKKNV